MITILEQPSQIDFYFINEPISIKVKMTGVDDGVVTKTLAYCLVSPDHTGVEITPRYQYTPLEDVPFEIDFQNEVKALLNTPIQPINEPYLMPADLTSVMSKVVLIKLIEISFNKETCISTEAAPIFNLAQFVIINAARSYQSHYEEDADWRGCILSEKPTTFKMIKGHADFLYLASLFSGYTVRVDLFNDDYSFENYPESLTELSISIKRFNTLVNKTVLTAPNYNKLKVTVSHKPLIGESPYSPYIYFVDIIEPCLNKCTFIYQTQRGGYNAMAVDIINRKTTTTTSTTAYRTPNSGYGGIMQTNKETFIEIEVAIHIDIINTVRDRDIVNQIQSSGHYYLIQRDKQGIERMISCINVAQSYDNIKSIIKMTLRHYLPLDQPNYIL